MLRLGQRPGLRLVAPSTPCRTAPAVAVRALAERVHKPRYNISRIGKLPIPIPPGVEVSVRGTHVAVKGPLGALDCTVSEVVAVGEVRNGVGSGMQAAGGKGEWVVEMTGGCGGVCCC